MSQKHLQVLIVEDEVVPAEYLASIISDDARFHVADIVTSAPRTWDLLAREPIDVIFMDIMIEGAISGAELALEVHHRYPDILIIFATAYSDDEMTDYAAEAGAFAYLLKPYRPRQVAATLKLVAARLGTPAPRAAPVLLPLAGGFDYHIKDHRLERDGRTIDLSANELALIDLLATERHRTLSREALMERLELSDESLRSLIYRLRKHTAHDLIQNPKRSGYRIGLAEDYP